MYNQLPYNHQILRSRDNRRVPQRAEERKRQSLDPAILRSPETMFLNARVGSILKTDLVTVP